MALSKEVEQGLVAGAFGLIGTLVPVVLTWTRERDVASARMRKLDEATRRVAFWDQWLKLSGQIPDMSSQSAVELVRRELAVLSAIIQNDSLAVHEQLATQQHRTTEFTGRVHALGALRRALLFYRPERSLAWFPRFLFYLGFFSFFFFGFMQWVDKANVEGFIIIEFMTLVWTLVFRGLSRWLEQPRGAAILAPAPTPPPSKS